MMSNMITINEFGFRHIADWTIFPFISTDETGWQFTWIFFQFTRFKIDESDLNEDGDFSEYGDH